MPKLTKTLVESAEPGPDEQQILIWDTEVKGFGLRITPAGVKSYFLNYRADGRQRRVTIGKHGSPWTCNDARARALALQREIAAGVDPLEERDRARKAMTLKDLCNDYLAAAEKGMIMGKRRRPKKPSTLETDRGRITRHIVPLLGTRKVQTLTTPDINRFMRDVIAGKTANVVKTKLRGKSIVKGGPGAAARTVGLLGGILSYAVSEGIITVNPAHGVQRPADKNRRIRLTPEEYRQLGQALEAAAAEGENGNAISALWVLALAGGRLGDVVKLRRSEVDAPHRCFRLEDTKEAESIRPAADLVLAELARVDVVKGCPFVFAGRDGKSPYGGLPGAVGRIAERAGLPQLTANVLRHSYASVGNDLGYTEATIGAIQGRSTKASVTGGYIHHIDSALIAAANRIAQHVYAQMTGKKAEVVPIRKGQRREA